MTLRYSTVDTLTLILAWAALTAYVSAPSSQALGLPAGLQLGDFLTLATAFGIIVLLASQKGRFPAPAHKGVVALFSIYILSVLTLPLFGMILYSAPLELYLGDLRWLAIILVGLSLILIYHLRGAERFVPHFTSFLLVLALIQLVLLGSQISMSVFGSSANIFLEIWYPGGEPGYGEYGHHIHRYAAGLYHASGLARLGGITFIFALFFLYMRLEKNRIFDYKLFFLLITGLLFIVAAGNRAMLFGVPPAVIFILVMVILVRSRITYKSFFAGFFVFLGMVGVAVLAFHYNIGRIASGDRLIQTINWLTGQTTLYEIGGRGEDLWLPYIQEAFTEFGWAGTLINASHALGTMDSYFVLSISQGGPFIIVPFLLLCISLVVIGIWMAIKGDYMGAVALGVVIPIILSSIAQNTMTGLSARVFLTLAVCGLYVRRVPFSRY